MSGVPSGWDLLPLTDIADVRLGRQRSPKNHTGSQMRPYLRAANVGWKGLLLDDVKEMNFTDDEMITYRLESGDLLFSEASGSPGEVGKPALWAGEIEDCAFQNTLLRARPFKAEPKYLLHFFRHVAMDGQFVQHSRGVGIHHLGRARLASWEVPLPTILEQRRIFDILEDHLSRLDAAASCLTTASARLARLEQSLLSGIRGSLMSSTRSVPLGDICDTSLGKMLDAKKAAGEPTPYLRNINVRWGGFDLGDVKLVRLTQAERDRLSLRPGDLMVCEGGEPGRCAVWPGGHGEFAFQKALHRVRVKNGSRVSPYFVALMLRESIRSGRADRLFTGTTIKHLPQEKLRMIEIPLTDLHAQESIVAAVGEQSLSLSRLSAALDAASRRETAVRRSLLTAAFAGRLTGSSTDNDLVEEMAGV